MTLTSLVWLRPSDTQGLAVEVNKKGGGVAVFVRNNIDSVLCQIDQLKTFEHITVKLSEGQSSQLIVHVIY